MSNLLVAGQAATLPPVNGSEINSASTKQLESIDEGIVNILDWNIGYCRYGRGPINFLFICGGVGK